MRRSMLSAVLSLSVLLSTFVAAQDASYTFTTIDVPGAISTFAYGINNAGQIVGIYQDTSQVIHCFLYSEGLFTTLDVPGATGTGCLSINNQGQIVGIYSVSPNPVANHSFLYDGGVFTTLQVPGSVETQAFGINDSRQISGSYYDGNQGRYGFLYDGGVFTTIGVPGAFLTSVHGINASGQIVGLYQDSDNIRHGFLYDDGVFTIIGVPPGASHAATEFNGINASSQIVGRYAAAIIQGYHGFLYDGGVYTTIDVPGASDTYFFGINDEGQIVGSFYDATGPHGFVATPTVPDTTPPLITVAASPATLSPPNGRLVTVTVSGRITDESGGSGVRANSAAYQVLDEYGQIHPSGTVTLVDSGYAFTVALQASRRGNDPDGRHYMIAVSANDNIGNPGFKSTIVTVPHD